MRSTVPYGNCVLDDAEISLELPPESSVAGRLFKVMPLKSCADAEAQRSMSRYRRAALSGFSSIFAKLIVLITTVVSVPLTFRYLGMDRYGLWMTLTSFVLFLGFADFGIGNGLASAIFEAHGKQDDQLARRQTSCGFFLLLSFATTILLFLTVSYHIIPWGRLYGTSTALAAREAGPSTAILVICAALSMPLGTVLRVQIGYQQGFVGDLWNAAGNALALAGIVYVARVGGGLPLLVLAAAGAPVLVTALNWLVQFFYVRPWLRPSLALFDRKGAMSLAAVGGLFFVQQCFGLLYYVSDNMVIARTMGATEVAQFAVLQRIFSIGLIAQYFMVPLWPAIGESVARGDLLWAHRIIRRAALVSVLLGSFCAVCLLCGSRYLMKRWSGIDPGPVDSLRIGFAVWVVLVGYIAAMNAILNQPGTMVRHLKLFGAGAVLSLALKIIFAMHGSISGVIWATVIGFGTVYVIPATRLALRSVVPAGGAADGSL